jgi:hypothetical protein
MLWTFFWTFPFDAETPLKIYFQQTVQLEGAVMSIPYLPPSTPSSSSLTSAARVTQGLILKVITSLYGVPEYLQSDIIPTLPSAQNQKVECFKSQSKLGLIGCYWNSGAEMIPRPGSAPQLSVDLPSTATPPNNSTTPYFDEMDFFQAEVMRTTPTSARFSIRGKNSRNCRLYFDNRNIIKYDVNGAAHGMQRHYTMPQDGISQLRLWSREWDKAFIVDVEWRDYLGLGEGLKGRVACEWAEYASASAGVPGQGEDPKKGGFRSAKIPALEELLSFLPTWVVATKFTDGLVEAWEYFEV